MATLEKGGNAFDAAVRHRFHAAGGRAASERAGRRRAGDLMTCGKRQARSDLRAGAGAAGATITHYRDARPRSRPGHRAAGGLACPACSRPGCCCCAITARCGLPTCCRRRSPTRATAIRWSNAPAPPSPWSRTCSAITGRPRPRFICRTARCRSPARMFANAKLADTYARMLREAESAGGDREADRARAQNLVAGFCRRGDRQFCRTQEVMDTSGERHRGVLTADDMARWQARVEAPATLEYGRYTVCKCGAWNQGPAMLQQLALMKQFNLGMIDPTSADFIHMLIECSKLAFADRDKFYGDPDFVEVPLDDSAVRCLQRRAQKLIGDRASLEQRPGNRRQVSASSFAVRVAGGTQIVAGAGEPTVGSSTGRTTKMHDPSAVLSMARSLTAPARCAATPCISTSSTRPATWCRRRRRAAGCNPRRRSPSSASALARARSMFWLDPEHPSALAPGKRPRTTLTPTIGTARRRAVSRLGLARRRPAGSMDRAVFPAPRACRHEFAGGDRRAGLAFRAFRRRRSGRARRAPACSSSKAASAEATIKELRAPRPRGRSRPGLVGRPAHRRLARRNTPPRRRQSARHARLRGRTIIGNGRRQ